MGKLGAIQGRKQDFLKHVVHVLFLAWLQINTRMYKIVPHVFLLQYDFTLITKNF